MRQRFARYQAGSIPSNRENRLCVVGLNEQNTADGRKKTATRAHANTVFGPGG